jgi:HEAT repeat protein
VAAAIVLIAAGLVVVPKLTAPDVESLRAKADVPGLVAALAYEHDPQIRASAALALGALGTREALVPLLAAQADADPVVVAAAKTAPLALLVRLPDDQAAADLIGAKIRLAPPVGGSGGVAEQTLAQYLAQIGPPRALRATLVVQSDPRAKVRAIALSSSLAVLTPYSPSQSVTILIELAEINGGAWSEGASATLREYLGALGNARALPTLFTVQGDTRSTVSSAAKKAISALLSADTDKHAVTALSQVIKGSTAEVSQRASVRLTDYLVALGVKRAVKAVRAAKAGDKWLAIALRVKRSQLSAETRRRNIQLDALDWIRKQVAGVPKGKRLKGAPGYTASRGFHPVIVIRKGDAGYSWKAGAPTALRFLELVAVVADSHRVVQVCRYTHSMKVTRYRNVVTVRLYSAKNSRLIATKTLTGGMPSACKSTIWGYEGQESQIDGSMPAIRPWLNSKVHAP